MCAEHCSMEGVLQPFLSDGGYLMLPSEGSMLHGEARRVQCLPGRRRVVGPETDSVTCINGQLSQPRIVCVEATCFDGEQNGDETGVDCGGASCESCSVQCSNGRRDGAELDTDCGGPQCSNDCPATCYDRVLNGDEVSVDCGGFKCGLEDCPSCTDQIQNGDEDGVDCGGSQCPACAACIGSPVPYRSGAEQYAFSYGDQGAGIGLRYVR
eukprot:Lankesteria_metandrocarpae@DN8104_c0_g1_i1.p1